jgi:host factor-I protein
MTSEKSVNVQDSFLNYLRKNKIAVTIFLLNGVKLNGTISGFDHGVIVLRKDGYAQLIYKHAISTFCPHGIINLFGWNAPPDGDPVQERVDGSHEGLDELEYYDRDSEDEEYL